MKRHSLGKLTAILSLQLLVATAFAQDTGQNQDTAKLAPTNFADKNNAAANKNSATANETIDNSLLVDNLQDSLSSLLLNNKSVSLMFDDRQNENIERAIDSLKSNQVYVPEEAETAEKVDKPAEDSETKVKKEQDEFNKKSYIYLASIMYSTPQDWVVWVNDKKITSDSNKKGKELFLKSVSQDKVSILWNVSPSKLKVLLGKKADSFNLKANEAGQIEIDFTLQPNQTFVLGSNSVVEGKVMTNMLKKKGEEKNDKTQQSSKASLANKNKDASPNKNKDVPSSKKDSASTDNSAFSDKDPSFSESLKKFLQ